MASSIISCCRLAEMILTCELNVANPQFIAYILIKTAQNQAAFINRHLKVGDLFYAGEDVTPEDALEPQLQIASKNPDLLSQFAVLHAFTELIKLNSYHVFSSGFSIEEFESCMSLLQGHLIQLDMKMESLSSRDLSLLGLHLLDIYKSSDVHWELCRNPIIQLARVLIHRVTSSGNIQRNHHSEEISSPYTTANCLNFLAQSAYVLNSKSCYKAANSIYERFNNLWDSKHGIFLMKDSNKQSLNFKDISSILAALLSFRLLSSDKNKKKSFDVQIAAFFEACFVRSGIFNGQSSPILQTELLLHHKDIKPDPKWAPVFNKGFEYKLSKGKYYCEADVFRADYILPACVILLGALNI